MLSVRDWAEIRRLRRAEGLPIKVIARVLGISKNTVKAALASDQAPKYERRQQGSTPSWARCRGCWSGTASPRSGAGGSGRVGFVGVFGGTQGSADRLLGSFRHRHARDLTQLQQTQIVAANLLHRNVSRCRRDAN
jgi:hypothetical protein